MKWIYKDSDMRRKDEGENARISLLRRKKEESLYDEDRMKKVSQEVVR